MSIELVKAEFDDLNTILQMQKEAFSKLYAKYQDTETSPATEKYEDILLQINSSAAKQEISCLAVVCFVNSKSQCPNSNTMRTAPTPHTEFAISLPPSSCDRSTAPSQSPARRAAKSK